MALTRVLALLALVAACAGGALAADKKHAAAPLPEVPQTLTAEEADAFLARLTDAQARELLARQLHQGAKKKAAEAGAQDQGFGTWLMQFIDELQTSQTRSGERKRVVTEGAALLPATVSSGAAQALGGSPGEAVLRLLMLAAILLAGWAVSRAVRQRLLVHGLQPALGVDAPASSRMVAAIVRFLLDLVPLAAFALVTMLAAQLASDAGNPERILYATYATAATLVLGLAILLRLVLSPASPALRPLPIADDAARFLYRWLLAIWALAVIGSLTGELLMPAAAPREAHAMAALLVGSTVAAVLVAMTVAARSVVPAASLPALLARSWTALGIAYVLGVWALWAMAVLDGHPSLVGAAAASLGIVLAFPLLDYWVGRAIGDVLGTPGSELERHGMAGPLRWAMRVLLAVLLVSAVNELWGFQHFAWQVALRRTLLDASFDLVSAFAVAVLGWQFIKVAIDRHLEPREVNGVLVEPNQRVRTLLPLARVFLVAGLIATTGMLVLAGLGVNIGPLLAGAGILGLAIGFGAQTLVRDIITGVFLIMDDAFRVGEYILSGNYKGTVESIGLRSVKLRHHRGPIYVVPFGELRGVQNVSRDWVIHKFTIGITYDSDLEKARKLVKKIGQQLAEDPEYKDTILEPLKMQGVETFGDFAIQVRMKMMTRPGDKQFGLKRKAHALIKKAFDENGVKFAFPTVQIAGGADAAVAAAATRVPGIVGDPAA